MNFSKILIKISHINIPWILDASGEFGLNLKKKLVINEFNWTGIEKEKNLPNSFENYSFGNIIHDDLPNSIDNLQDDFFECIFALDILEHLPNPEKVLLKLKSKIKLDGTLIVSIPILVIIQ